MAAIVPDLLFVQRHYQNGINSLVIQTEVQETWALSQPPPHSQTTTRLGGNHGIQRHLSNISRGLRLTLYELPVYALATVLLWAAASVALSWGIDRRFPDRSPDCSNSRWWCSILAVSPKVKEYVGFALFLVLAFRITVSHRRYVRGLELWLEGVLGGTRRLSERLFEVYPRGTWHDGDFSRISGHIAAFPIVLIAKLRGNEVDCEALRPLLCEEDMQRISCCLEPQDYCLDVVRRYLTVSDVRATEEKRPDAAAFLIHKFLYRDVDRLRGVSRECLSMTRFDMPFGYVAHMRIFLCIWLFLLPFGLVETSGWAAIAWTVIIAMGVIGTEIWAEDLAHPFGQGLSDLPLEELAERAVEMVRENKARFYDGGTDIVVKAGRAGLGESTADDGEAILQTS